MHDQDQRQEREDAGDDADHRAADELADLLADLGLGQLDLLADQRRGALGDLEDELADRPWLGSRGGGGMEPSIGRGYSGGSSSKMRRQMIAETRVATMLAIAPVAARRPLQTSLLTMSLSTYLDLPFGRRGVNHLGVGRSG